MSGPGFQAGTYALLAVSFQWLGSQCHSMASYYHFHMWLLFEMYSIDAWCGVCKMGVDWSGMTHCKCSSVLKKRFMHEHQDVSVLLNSVCIRSQRGNLVLGR
jgi:hypothetical protein